MNKHIIWTIVIALVIGGLGFWGGTKYGQNGDASGGRNRNLTAAVNLGTGPGNVRGGARGSRLGGGGAVAGEILSLDEQNLVVKLPTGGSKIVFWTKETPLSKNVAAGADDLKVGSRVMVMGTPNQDGSVTARAIELREK